MMKQAFGRSIVQTVTRTPSVTAPMPYDLVAQVDAIVRVRPVAMTPIVSGRSVENVLVPTKQLPRFQYPTKSIDPVLVRVDPAVNLVVSEIGHRAALQRAPLRSFQTTIDQLKRKRYPSH